MLMADEIDGPRERFSTISTPGEGVDVKSVPRRHLIDGDPSANPALIY